MNAAYLFVQLEKAEEINNDRMKSWNYYMQSLKELEERGRVELPVVPKGCAHNAHMLYMKAKDQQERIELIRYLVEYGIQTVFHYIPLHSAPAGEKCGEFRGEDKYTLRESERLLRLPLYYGLTEQETEYVTEKIRDFYKL